MTEQPERAAVSPVQIVYIKEQALTPRETREQVCHCVKKQQALFMRRQLVTRRERADARFNFRSQLRDLRRSVAEQLFQLRVVFLLARPAPERFNERQIRCGRFILVTGAAQYDR